MKHVIVAAVLTVIMAAPAVAGEAERAADALASATSKMEGMHCGAKHGSRTIICIVNASDRDTDRIAAFIIMQARSMDVPLHGWSLMLANPDDYVVSMNF